MENQHQAQENNDEQQQHASDHLNGLSKDLSSERVRLMFQLIEAHRAQLVSCGLPERYWPFLFEKLSKELFDAGDYFQIIQRVDEDDNPLGYKAICARENGLSTAEPDGVFLVDHAWTYRLNEARNCLKENRKLIDRMCNLMCIETTTANEHDTDDETSDEEEKIDLIMKNMWKFNQTYKLSTERLTDDEREPIWYIMDEFGSSIRHSDEPTVSCAPFYYLPSQTMYSIIWPLKNLECGEEITRDYVYGIKDEEMRKAKLYPWQPTDEMDELENFALINDGSEIVVEQQEPSISYFNSGKEAEQYNEEQASAKSNDHSSTYLNEKLKVGQKVAVFTDLNEIKQNLDEQKYRFVDDMKEADVIFIRKHFKDYKNLYQNSPLVLVNQFPFENVVTVKDLLAVVCRRNGDAHQWLPTTFNLKYELPLFIKYFNKRESLDLDNHWILKPFNLARSIDTSVTKNLNQIIRSQETCPKIACKYITNPVLFYREELNASVKYDIRYIVLLRSIQPLKIFTYNVFWLRFANKPFVLENLEDYETHFTVMNYRPTNLKQVHCDEFIQLFEKQHAHAQLKWSSVQENIFKMIRKVFDGSTREQPPRGFANNLQSRAMYAIDLMLEWNNVNKSDEITPKICEINFMPDCTRACKYHPSFFNDVFGTLFLDDSSHNRVTDISHFL